MADAARLQIDRAAAERRRRLARNPALVHMAVQFLRRNSHRVVVAKRVNGVETNHELDGQIGPTTWLVDMAKTYGFKPEFVTSADPTARPRR